MRYVGDSRLMGFVGHDTAGILSVYGKRFSFRNVMVLKLKLHPRVVSTVFCSGPSIGFSARKSIV